MIRYHYVIFIFTFYFSNKLWAFEGLIRSLQNKKQNKIKSKGPDNPRGITRAQSRERLLRSHFRSEKHC